jgi:G3E family GTPase
MNVFKKIMTELPTKDWHKNTAENKFDKVTNKAGQIMEVRKFEDKGNNVYIVTYVTENNEEEKREREAVKMIQDIYNKKRQQDIEDKEKMLFALMHIKNGKELRLHGINKLSREETIKSLVQEEAERMYDEAIGEKWQTNKKELKEETKKIKQKWNTKEPIEMIGGEEKKEETIKEMKNNLYYEMIKEYLRTGTTGLDKRPVDEIKKWVNSYSVNVKEMIKNQEKTIRNYELAVKEMEEERKQNRK